MSKMLILFLRVSSLLFLQIHIIIMYSHLNSSMGLVNKESVEPISFILKKALTKPKHK